MGGLLKEEINKQVHLVGIGGIGMGALASLLLAKGHRVSGSDLKENQMTRRLREKGAHIFIGHNAENMKGAQCVVFSSAIDPNNPELVEAKNQNLPLLPRAALLAELMKGQIGITIAGAHGKTTTTSMISNLLTKAGLDPTTAIGGIVNGTTANAQLGRGKYFVAEVDESDGSFLFFAPQYSVITNIDFEHVDYYRIWRNILKAYKEFIQKTAEDGMLFVCASDVALMNLVKKSKRPFKSYGFSLGDDICAAKVKLDALSSYFECIVNGQRLGEINLKVPGKHNVLNALAAIGVGLNLSIDFNIIRQSLLEFKGVERRFQIVGRTEDILVVDDYAHHPTEIRATLKTAQNLKKKRLVTVFQPHRYSRVKFLMKEFAEILPCSDYLILTDIYAASEKPIKNITAQKLLEKIKKNSDKPCQYVPKEKIIEYLSNLVEPGDLVLMMGAGDITRVAHDFAATLKTSIKHLGRVGVLMGGYSSEREISLKSGNSVVEALQGGGYDVVPMDIVQTGEEEIASFIAKSNIDIAFIALHGRLGEDGAIQSILENLFIPYTGSGVQASRLAINKALTQTLFKNNGIVVPAHVILDKEDSPSTESILKNIGDLPWVVKPACEGSSIGISLVQNFSEFNPALKKAREYGWQVLIERFIAGRELTIGIFEDRPLPIIEIRSPKNFFDFTAKYQAGLTEYIIPAQLPKGLELTLQEQALKAHRTLGCRDLSRVDMILTPEGTSYVLEVNTIPGFTSMSLLPKAAKASGVDFNQLCSKLVELAYGQKKENQTISV